MKHHFSYWKFIVEQDNEVELYNMWIKTRETPINCIKTRIFLKKSLNNSLKIGFLELEPLICIVWSHLLCSFTHFFLTLTWDHPVYYKYFINFVFVSVINNNTNFRLPKFHCKLQ